MAGNESPARYARQMILPAWGRAGQEKLARARVLVVGAGGLGSPAALYLAAAGVGTLGIADADVVELENLHRQILHRTGTLGRPKVASAAAALRDFNPEVRVIEHPLRIDAANAGDIIGDYDVVVDASDNFATRYLVNDTCVQLDKPFAHGAVLQFEGQMLTVLPRRTACLRCLFPSPPPPGLVPSTREAGILGTVPGVIGTLQANEVIKLILGIGELMTDRLLIFNALQTRFRELRVPRNPRCPVCGKAPTMGS